MHSRARLNHIMGLCRAIIGLLIFFYIINAKFNVVIVRLCYVIAFVNYIRDREKVERERVLFPSRVMGERLRQTHRVNSSL